MNKAMTMRKQRAEKAAVKVRDRRRFTITSAPDGIPSRVVPLETTGTIFPSAVRPVTADSRVLMTGTGNCKLGGDVLVGWLKGAHIFQLAFEERKTCPRSCAMWTTCMGNAMPFQARWETGPALEAALRREVPDLCANHGRILIRLHVVGDFYSMAYLRLWAKLLDNHPGLHIFGFTAHDPSSRMGAAIGRLRAVYPRRFAIRHSGVCGPWGSFTVDFPTPAKTMGTAVVCPEQREAVAVALGQQPERGRHCGNCGVCWSTDAPIVFMVH
jgi:hypothetical protein